MGRLTCVEIEPSAAADAAVIWLHGLGANGHDFEPIVPELRLPQSMAVRFVFPNAPSIPVTINGGMVMPAWYDILSLDIDRRIDHEQIMASAVAIVDLVEREIARGIAPRRIVLAGFSQGGAVAYQAALSYPQRLAGLMVLSTYLATAETLERSAANQGLPIFAAHGSMDPVVPEILGQRAVQQLKQWGYPVEYTTYPMQHQVCMPQINDISRWLQERLPGKEQDRP
jgi:phospholipase/carboxylesterase